MSKTDIFVLGASCFAFGVAFCEITYEWHGDNLRRADGLHAYTANQCSPFPDGHLECVVVIR